MNLNLGIPVTRHLSDLHSPTQTVGPSAPSRKDSMPQGGTPVGAAFGLQGRIGSGNRWIDSSKYKKYDLIKILTF